MSDSVVFDIDGDPKGAVKAFERVQKELEKTKAEAARTAAEFKKLEKASEDAGDAGVGVGTAIVDGIGKGLATIATLTTATQILSNELDNVIRRQQQAAKTVIKTANADLGMARNVAVEDLAFWRQQAPGMAKRVGLPIDTIKTAIGNASAAQGNNSRETVMQNVEMAARVAPDNADEMQTIAGGLGDASRATGTGDVRVNMGLIQQMGKQARVKSTKMIAENLIPGVVGTMGYGGNAEQAAALNTTMSTLLGDTTGAVTKTNTIAGAREMDRILGEKGTPLEHITALQNDPALRKKFFEGSKGKPGASLGESEVAWKNLLTKGSEADKLMRKNLGEYGNHDQLRKVNDEWMKETFGDENQKVATLERRMAMHADQMQNADLKGATAGTLRDSIFGETGIFKTSGIGGMDNQLSAWQYDAEVALGRSPEGAAERALVDRRKTLSSVDFATPEKAAENAEVLKRLDTMIQELRTGRMENKKPRGRNVDAHVE